MIALCVPSIAVVKCADGKVLDSRSLAPAGSVAATVGLRAASIDGPAPGTLADPPATSGVMRPPATTGSQAPQRHMQSQLALHLDVAKGTVRLAVLLGGELPLVITKTVATGTARFLWRRAFRRN